MTADISVVAPSMAAWHEHHEVAPEAVGEATRVPAHVLVETVSTLSRLPGGVAQPLDVLGVGKPFRRERHDMPVS